MARHLTRMRLNKVSLVDRGANAKRFAVLKRAGGDDMGDEITKAGRKISEARAARLREARDAINEVLAESEVTKATDTTTEGEDMALDPQTLANELAPLLDPIINERVSKAVAEAIAKHDEQTPAPAPTGDDSLTLAHVAEAVGALADRIGALEASPSGRQSASGGGEPVAKSRESVLSGIL